MRYSFTNLKTAITQPRLILEETNRYLTNGLNHRTRSCHYSDGIDIFDSDWDNLIILDACRFDTFEKVGSDLPGDLEKRESKGSCTSEFLLHNFQNKKLNDTIYITANPQLYRIENGVYEMDAINVEFYKQYDLWIDNWNDEHQTVLPDVVTQKAQRVNGAHPNKRLIIHYLQPHSPYIGPTATQLPSDSLQFWNSFKRGELEIPIETVKQAYKENVEIVLSDVEILLEELPGKTVVSSDHGELFGERDFPIPIRQYGHPKHTYLPDLVSVPWLVYQNGRRKTINEGDGQIGPETGSIAESTIKKRLKDLGYA